MKKAILFMLILGAVRLQDWILHEVLKVPMTGDVIARPEHRVVYRTFVRVSVMVVLTVAIYQIIT